MFMNRLRKVHDGTRSPIPFFSFIFHRVKVMNLESVVRSLFVFSFVRFSSSFSKTHVYSTTSLLRREPSTVNSILDLLFFLDPCESGCSVLLPGFHPLLSFPNLYPCSDRTGSPSPLLLPTSPSGTPSSPT